MILGGRCVGVCNLNWRSSVEDVYDQDMNECFVE